MGAAINKKVKRMNEKLHAQIEALTGLKDNQKKLIDHQAEEISNKNRLIEESVQNIKDQIACIQKLEDELKYYKERGFWKRLLNASYDAKYRGNVQAVIKKYNMEPAIVADATTGLAATK